MMVTTTHEDEGEGGPPTVGRPYVMATTTVHMYIRTYVHTYVATMTANSGMADDAGVRGHDLE